MPRPRSARGRVPGGGLGSIGVDITVVGAGVSGVTTAWVLTQRGHRVQILAEASFEGTVSRVAAAVWTMTDAEPVERTRAWALTSREHFARLAEDPATGVQSRIQIELERSAGPASWWESTPHVRRLGPNEVPESYATGWRVDGFTIDPIRYLPWMLERLEEHGVARRVVRVTDLTDVEGDAVVNCTGLGAAALVGDTELFPVLGQVVVVEDPGLDIAIADESDPDRISYVYPRSGEVVLGGLRARGVLEPDSEAPATIDADLTARILSDAIALESRLEGREVLAVRAGHRPGRGEVRVERVEMPDGRPLVHNYGHGGVGYVLSWGCALEVVALLEDEADAAANRPAPIVEP